MDLREAVSSFTKDICYISEACAKSLVKYHGKTVLGEDHGSIIFEFDYLFIHVIDRYANMICHENVRNVFMESLGLSVINTRINSCLINGDNNVVEEARNNELDRLNKRNIEYANYEKMFPDEGEVTKNTLFWEFGKKITFDYLHSSNPAEIVYCALLGSDIITKLKLEENLKNVGLYPPNSTN